MCKPGITRLRFHLPASSRAVILNQLQAMPRSLDVGNFDVRICDTGDIANDLRVARRAGDDFDINWVSAMENSRCQSGEGFDDAVQAAAASDVVLMVMGEESILSGEAHCRADISLPGAQLEIRLSSDLTNWSTVYTRPAEGGDWIPNGTIAEVVVDPVTGAVTLSTSGFPDKNFAQLRISL